MPDGSAFYSRPSKKYQGGFYINDLGNPIIKRTKVPRVNKTGQIIKDKHGKPSLINKDVLCGYSRRELTVNDCPIPKFAQDLDFDIVPENEVPNEFGGKK